jgi:hypothetical protein
MAEQEPQPDDRPRPKYGELAPPGWVWHPPADADRLDTSRPAPRDETSEAPAGAPLPRFGESQPGGTPRPGPGGHPGPGGPSSPTARPVPTWNVTLTVMLTVFGFFGMLYSITGLQGITASMQLLHTTNSLGDYTPAPIVSTLILVGSIILGAVWAVSAVIAAWLLMKRRLAFWVPLVAGIVAMTVLLIFSGAVLATDPALLNFYSGVTPPATPTTPTTPPTPTTTP